MLLQTNLTVNTQKVIHKCVEKKVLKNKEKILKEGICA